MYVYTAKTIATVTPSRNASQSATACVSNFGGFWSGDTTPCRMTGVTLHSHFRYKDVHPTRGCIPRGFRVWVSG